ncbi:MAG: hypothetical protein V3U75_05105 [Methylococcaceae bacterium]
MLPKTITALVNAAHFAPSADNSQPLGYSWNGQWLSVFYDSLRVEGRTFGPKSPATLLTVGAALENIIQLANTFQVDLDIEESKIETGPDNEYFRFRVPDPDKALDDYQTHSLFSRHTNRLPYQKKPISADIFEKLQGLSEGDARILVISDRSAIKDAGRLVNDASKIRFQTREVHEWLGKSLRFKKKEVDSGDGLDIATLGLPPGGSLTLKIIKDWRRMAVLNRFGVYKLLSFIDSQPVKQAPGLVAIISPGGYEESLSAGKLMVRTWGMLNQENLGVQPYFVISDQMFRLEGHTVPSPLVEQAGQLATSAKRLFSLNNSEKLQMLFRVGYEKRKPIHSRRIPIEDVVKIL